MTSYETTLVRLWGILEQLTHTDRYATLRRRVLFLFEDGTGIDGLILDDLRERRNVEVHREAMSRKGGSARSQASVMAMKRYVEELLLFVLKAGHLFKSLSEVGEFLDSPTNESEIGRRRRLTQFAEHFLAGRPFPGRLKR